jgi:hypothetical protein
MLTLGTVYMMWIVGGTCTRYMGDASNFMMTELLLDLIRNRCASPPGALKVYGPNERVRLKTLELTRRICVHLAIDILKQVHA